MSESLALANQIALTRGLDAAKLHYIQAAAEAEASSSAESAQVYDDWAGHCLRCGLPDEALALLQKGLEHARARARRSPMLALLARHQGDVLAARGEWTQAAAAYLELVEQSELGESLCLLAYAQEQSGQSPRATLERAVDALDAELGPSHVRVADVLCVLAAHVPTPEKLLRRALGIYAVALGEDHASTRAVLAELERLKA